MLIKTDEQQEKIIIPRGWLDPQEDSENGYVSSCNYDETVTSFNIGNGRIGLHLSSYEIQQEGSAQAAAGRDVFLVYHSENHSIHPGIIDLGVTKERVRSMGWYAKNSRFLLSDMNNDGLIDIGIIKEELECLQFIEQKDGTDYLDRPSYKIYPNLWYIFKDDRWVLVDSLNGKVPSISYRELPLIGLIKTPVDFIKEICFNRNILILEYEDFGVQSMSYELLGFQWYQWDNHGSSDPDEKYNIRVVVYKNICLEEVRTLYPVNKDSKQDYRYVEYREALNYLDEQIKQIEEIRKTDSGDQENADLYEDLISVLQSTRNEIVTKLDR